jgi:dTDP-4-dehydrorhamnose reductase
MKAMLRIATERISVSVVNDQIGTPTHAVDLAKAILDIIRQVAATLSTLESRSLTDQPSTIHQLQPPYGTYHFSNEGQCSWYDFAKKIFEVNNIEIDLHPIPTSAFPTAAKRPRFSVLDKEKIAKVFNIRIREWENALTATKQ